jgi:pantothenate kinase-related protein Tda10
MPEPITLKRSESSVDRTLASNISDRLSQELVIALVGPVGSGVSTSAGYLAEILTNHFGYDVAPIIKLSSFIRNEAHRVGLGEVPAPLANTSTTCRTPAINFGINLEITI